MTVISAHKLVVIVVVVILVVIVKVSAVLMNTVKELMRGLRYAILTVNLFIFVTGFMKTDQVVTFCILRNAVLKL